MKNMFNSGETTPRLNRREWLKLLMSALVPLMIGIFTVVTTMQQKNLSVQQRQQDKEDTLLLRQQSERQADNLQKQSVFTTYIDNVAKLLMLEIGPKSLLHMRTTTLTTLRQLDPERKKHLLLFLYESELVYNYSGRPDSSLLKVIDADFGGIYFKGTNEARCSFMHLYLPGAYLSNASFINCYIDRSNFSTSIMYNVVFSSTLLFRSTFKYAVLDKANFSQAKFLTTNFMGASLVECDFTGARVNNNADFTNTNLTGAIISDEQLRNSTLYNAILPNGTWGPIQMNNLLVNGDAENNCTANRATILTGWTVSSTGQISAITYNNQNSTEKFGKCYFRATSFNSKNKIAYAFQRISLDTFSLLISAGIARYNASVNFQCPGYQSATIDLRFADMNGLKYDSVGQATIRGPQIQYLTVSNILHSDIRSVLVYITIFKSGNNIINATIDEEFCIGDNVKFSIMKS